MTKREVKTPFDFAIEDRDIPTPPKALEKWLKAALEGLLESLAEGQWMTGMTNLAAMRWSVQGFDGDAIALEPDDFVETVTRHLKAEAGILVDCVHKHGQQQATKDWLVIRMAWLRAIEQIDAEAARIAELPEKPRPSVGR